MSMLNPSAPPFECSQPGILLPPLPLSSRPHSLTYFYQLPPPPPPLPFYHPPLSVRPPSPFLSTYTVPHPLSPPCSSAPMFLSPATFSNQDRAIVEDDAAQSKKEITLPGEPKKESDNATPALAAGIQFGSSAARKDYKLMKGKRAAASVWLPRSIINHHGGSCTVDGIAKAEATGAKGAAACLPSMSFEFNNSESEDDHDQRTSVMIKNIPNKLSRDMLISLLDEHCVEENNNNDSTLDGSTLSEYDFIYLPIDFKNKCNLGYAFVNFTKAAAARRFYSSMHGHKWKLFDSKKISHICYARIQGKRGLVQNFRSSLFRCDTDEYLPAVLSPPRNGSTSLSAPTPVGRRLSPPSSYE